MVLLLTNHDLPLQVMENGNPHDRKNWFPDIEPLFKLLSYENVPPYLKVFFVCSVPYLMLIAVFSD